MSWQLNSSILNLSGWFYAFNSMKFERALFYLKPILKQLHFHNRFWKFFKRNLCKTRFNMRFNVS